MGGGEEKSRVVPRLEMASLPVPDELLGEILLRLPTRPTSSTPPPPASPSAASPPTAPSSAGTARSTARPCSASSSDPRPSTPPLHRTPPHRQLALFFGPPTSPSHSSPPPPATGSCGTSATGASSSTGGRPLPASSSRRRWCAIPCTGDTSCFPHSLTAKPICSMSRSSLSLTATAETSFTAIWMALCETTLVAFVFSSNTGHWHAVPSRHWTDLFSGLSLASLFYLRQYVYGCFYWLSADREESKLLVLDAKTMEFSIAKPPSEANSCFDFAIVEAGEGRPGMFVLPDGATDLSYFIRQNDGGSGWQKVKTISLGSCPCLICNMDKYLLLHYRESSLLEPGCFTLDIETFQLKKVCSLGYSFFKLHAYSNFPPSLLSSPTISSGVEKGLEKEMLEQGWAASSSAESPWPSD